MININTKKIASLSVITALALIMFMVESFLPPLLIFAPGTKIGLANIFVFLALIIYGKKEAFTVLILKCALGAVFSGNVFSLYYSLPAGVTSLISAIVLFKFVYDKIGIITISILCALLHNIIQIIMAALLAATPQILSYIPLASAAGIIAGIITGLSIYFIIKYLPSKLVLY